MADMLGRENVQAGNVTEIADAIDVEVETDVSALATTAQLNATEAAIQTAVATLLGSTTSTETTGATANADTDILAANPLRKNFDLYNPPAPNAATMHVQVKAGAASAASFFHVPPGGYYFNDGERWQGPVRAFWDAGCVGNWICREVT